MILISNRFRFIFFLLFLINLPIIAQKSEDDIAKKRIHTDFNKYLHKHDNDGYVNHHRILKETLKYNYLRYELGSYRKLAKDHSLGEIGERNFDSILYYFDKYETKLVDIDTTKKENKSLLSEISSYYMTKAEILENEFGLNESGERSIIKAYPYLDKSKINMLIWYDLKMSTIYFNKKEYDKSLAIVNNRLKDTAKIKSTRKKALFDRIASIYMKKKRYGDAFAFYSKSLKIAEQSKNEDQIWSTKTRLNKSSFFYKDRQKAIDTALMIKNYYVDAKKGNRLKGLNRILIQLSNFYYWTGAIDKAVYYRKEAINLNISSGSLAEHYKKLAKYAMEQNDYKAAMEYYQKRDKVNDSIKEVEKMLLIKYSDANMKLMKEKQLNKNVLFENELLAEKNEKQKMFIWVISIILTSFLLLFGVFFFYGKYRRSNKYVAILKANEKQLLEEQIRLRDNELDASAIAISQRVEVLRTIKEELEAIKDDNPRLDKVNNTLKGLITSASDLSVVTDKINSQYPSVASNLRIKHPELSENEIRYCLLTKLNLSIKETANMLNVTPDTVKVTRSRIKKKMVISSDISLKDYLDMIHITSNSA